MRETLCKFFSLPVSGHTGDLRVTHRAHDRMRNTLREPCDSLQACSTVNQSKVYIPAEGRIECIRRHTTVRQVPE